MASNPIAIFRFSNYSAQIAEAFRSSIPPFFTVFNPGGGNNWQPNSKTVLEQTAARALQEPVTVQFINLNENGGTVQFLPETAPAFEAAFTIALQQQGTGEE